jgi:hypothetical protein
VVKTAKAADTTAKATGEIVSDSLLFVRIKDGSSIDDFLSELDELGTLNPLPGHAEGVLLHVSTKASDPKTVWQEVTAKLDKRLEALPVLVDAKDHLKVLLGTIAIRFKENPSEAQLRELESKYHLKLKARNKYTLRQVTFASDQEQYLPEVVDDLREMDGTIERVWPEAMSQYKREA